MKIAGTVVGTQFDLKWYDQVYKGDGKVEISYFGFN